MWKQYSNSQLLQYKMEIENEITFREGTTYKVLNSEPLRIAVKRVTKHDGRWVENGMILWINWDFSSADNQVYAQFENQNLTSSGHYPFEINCYYSIEFDDNHRLTRAWRVSNA